VATEKLSRPEEGHRGRLQQQRLLSAATECFRKCGFHNATIALISEHSGMSVGQIYHYFANKEAIIAACVEKQLDTVYALYDEFERSNDVTNAIIEGPPSGLEPRVDSDLMMEVHAEASRNPAIAKLIAQIDRRLRERIRQLIVRSDADRGREGAPDVELRAEALLALQIGTHVRLSLNPTLDREKFNRLLGQTFRAILES
jgi:AcrR family transcriptional regulator